MLRMKESFTVVTPIPSFIPRQLAISILHSHSEVITVNPLVIDHRPIPAPQNAEIDEYYATWYEITERVQVVPGIGNIGASTIRFKVCFQNMPWGLYTHVHGPQSIDMRNTYCIGGNQPGIEPPGPAAPDVSSEGLYLREEIEIECNMMILGLVKAEVKRSGGEMVKRIIKKAELLDAGVLQGMFEEGRLKTVNPADHSKSSPRSPTSQHYFPSVHADFPPTAYQVLLVQPLHPGYHQPDPAAGPPAQSSATLQYNPQLAAPRLAAAPPGRSLELSGAETNQGSTEMPADSYQASYELPQPDAPSPRRMHQ